LGIINAIKEINRVLVVCPASLKINWKRESEKWLIPGRFNIEIAESKLFPYYSNFVIINYDILGKHRESLREKEWDIIVIDEGQAIKNPQAQRTKEVKGSKKDGISPIPARRKLVLTGTPIENRPEEVWTIWQWLDSEKAPETLFDFKQKYYESWKEDVWKSQQKERAKVLIEKSEIEKKLISINDLKHRQKMLFKIQHLTNRADELRKAKKIKVWKYGKPKNLADLQMQLRSSIMIRRKTDEVLKDLPPKRRQIIELPLNGLNDLVQQEFEAFEAWEKARKEHENARQLESETDYRQRIKALKEMEEQSLAQLARLRRELALQKLPFLIEHLQDAIDSSGKVICFLYHREMVEKLQEHFGAAAVHLYGGMTGTAKQEAVDRFDRDPEVKLFIASILAAGVGLNLTVSNHEVFGEIDWVPGRIEQAEKRAHRIGQDRKVLVQTLVFESSLDAYMYKSIVEKMEKIDLALDV